MARKNYTDEFRRQAVDLYRVHPGRHAARDRRGPGDLPAHPQRLGRGPDRHGGTDGRRRHDPARCRARRTGGRRRRGLRREAELAALRARVAALETQNDELVAEQAKLVTERDILRQAAKYFAGETNW